MGGGLTITRCPSRRAHFAQSLLCRTVRPSSEPRSNSPVTGSLSTSFSRLNGSMANHSQE